MSDETWDMSITRVPVANGNKQSRITIPEAIARALEQHQFNRATVTLTPDGILIKPYHAPERPKVGRSHTVALPFADGNGS